MSNPAVCIATNRREHFAEWIAAWKDEFQTNKVQVFAMCDTQHAEDVVSKDTPTWVSAYDHQDVANLLHDRRWIIPGQTSACKSFAIWQAWKSGTDPILVLDDDCLPAKENKFQPTGLPKPHPSYVVAEVSQWVRRHAEILWRRTQPYVYNTIQTVRPRGVPYLEPARIVLNHGLWAENVDVDAITALSTDFTKAEGKAIHGPVPFGSLFPMCGMNLGFRREIAPLMYFGLQGPAWGVDRFDDIWCGFLAKKCLDYAGLACTSGEPLIRHVRASDPLKSIVKEGPGYAMNIRFYQWLMDYQIGTGMNRYLAPWDKDKGERPQPATAQAALEAIGTDMSQWGNGGDYFRNYGKAILQWLSLFKE